MQLWKYKCKTENWCRDYKWRSWCLKQHTKITTLSEPFCKPRKNHNKNYFRSLDKNGNIKLSKNHKKGRWMKSKCRLVRWDRNYYTGVLNKTKTYCPIHRMIITKQILNHYLTETDWKSFWHCFFLLYLFIVIILYTWIRPKLSKMLAMLHKVSERQMPLIAQIVVPFSEIARTQLEWSVYIY